MHGEKYRRAHEENCRNCGHTGQEVVGAGGTEEGAAAAAKSGAHVSSFSLLEKDDADEHQADKNVNDSDQCN